MNRHFALPLAISLVAVCRGGDFVRQIQLKQGQTIVYDIPVAGKTGDVLSKPLDSDGAVFQLYAYQDYEYNPWSLLDLNAGSAVHANVSLDSHLVDLDVLGIHLDINLGGSSSSDPLPKMLDETAVGTHLPESTVTLRSEDAYQPPRTRADRPYSLAFTLRKLADPTDPRGGISKAVLQRDFKVYQPDLHTAYPNGAGQGTYDGAYQFSRNGDYNVAAVYAALPATRPTKAIGEETFTCLVPLDDSGREVSIASSTIQIWPVCDATVEGIEPGKRYLGPPPEARAVFKDLYPDSVTYAQIYKGAPELGRTGTVLGSSVISFNTYAPQNAVVPLSVPASAIVEDGTYTIEVLTVTPFNGRKPERVTYLSFNLDRTIEVQGMMADSEK